ncbi:hypothetical protein DFJ74DRAFT_683322 [Hyaloraphidium curvatum]|nr:hypothetical protein DFJ74DRAFT_683322 [Hyaloraphidium curvatum]
MHGSFRARRQRQDLGDPAAAGPPAGPQHRRRRHVGSEPLCGDALGDGRPPPRHAGDPGNAFGIGTQAGPHGAVPAQSLHPGLAGAFLRARVAACAAGAGTGDRRCAVLVQRPRRVRSPGHAARLSGRRAQRPWPCQEADSGFRARYDCRLRKGTHSAAGKGPAPSAQTVFPRDGPTFGRTQCRRARGRDRKATPSLPIPAGQARTWQGREHPRGRGRVPPRGRGAPFRVVDARVCVRPRGRGTRRRSG